MRPYGLLFLGMNRLGHNLSILNLPKLGLFFDYFREPRLVGVRVLWFPFRWPSSRYIWFGISAYTFSVSLEACSKAWICLQCSLEINVSILASVIRSTKSKLRRKLFCFLHLWLIFSLCPTRTPHPPPPPTYRPPTTSHHPPPQPEGWAGQHCSSLARQVALNLQEVLVPKVGKACLGTIAQNLPSVRPWAICLQLLEFTAPAAIGPGIFLARFPRPLSRDR